MSGGKSQANESEHMLGLLKAVHENDSLTQRLAAKQVGVALGLVNTYLKRCIKKGFVKVVSAPRSRYSYYLTPKGFAEKSRLTAEYLSVSFNLFRATRAQYTELFEFCTRQGWREIAIAGVGDLTEIALMCANTDDINLVGFIDPAIGEPRYHDLPVLEDAASFAGHAVIITDLADPQGTYDSLSKYIAEERILVPDMLNVSRDKASEAAGG